MIGAAQDGQQVVTQVKVQEDRWRVRLQRKQLVEQEVSLPQVGGARPAQRVTINSQLLGPWPVKWNFVLRQLRFYGVLPGACELPVYK